MADLRIEGFPDDLYRGLKIKAAQEGTTVKAIMITAAEEVLRQTSKPLGSRLTSLKTHGNYNQPRQTTVHAEKIAKDEKQAEARGETETGSDLKELAKGTPPKAGGK